MAVYAYNSWSQDVIVGYTSIRIPMFNNEKNNVIEADLYRPISSNTMSDFLSWVKGHSPEYYDISTIGKSDVREVTRVKSNGKIKVTFNTLTKNLQSFGYTVNDQSIEKRNLSFITAGGLASLGKLSSLTAKLNAKKEKLKESDKKNSKQLGGAA